MDGKETPEWANWLVNSEITIIAQREVRKQTILDLDTEIHFRRLRTVLCISFKEQLKYNGSRGYLCPIISRLTCTLRRTQANKPFCDYLSY